MLVISDGLEGVVVVRIHERRVHVRAMRRPGSVKLIVTQSICNEIAVYRYCDNISRNLGAEFTIHFVV